MFPALTEPRPSLPPMTIDWRYHYAYRDLAQQLIEQGAELPRYLLAPEIAALLEYTPHEHCRMLLKFIWNTGARITEALSLTKQDVVFAPDGRAMVALVNLKRPGKGRPKNGKPVKRIVPILDDSFRRDFQRYLVTHVRNKRLPVFASNQVPAKAITPQTARNWLAQTVKAAAAQGLTFPDITVHSLRHSYAIHLLINGYHLKQLQLWLGHSDPQSTDIYTRLLSIDAGYTQKPVRFEVDTRDNPLLPD